MKYQPEDCEIVAELSANEQWGIDQETGEIDFGDLRADGGGGQFTNFLCETHGDSSEDWDDMVKHREDMAKAEKARTNAPGYLLGEKLTPYIDNHTVLETIKLKDRLAEIHNMALERSKRDN